MTVDRILDGARSPLREWHDTFAAVTAPVSIQEVPYLTQLSLRARPEGPDAAAAGRVVGAALPTTPCTFTETGDGQRQVLWLGPCEWLVLAPPGAAPDLVAALRGALDPQASTAVDVSAHRTTIDLHGPRAAGVLAHGCAIDLHPAVSPAGTCVQTLLAHAGVVLQVRDDTATSFRLLVRSASAPYLAAWLVDAATEYG